jgi:hypothetical protein
VLASDLVRWTCLSALVFAACDRALQNPAIAEAPLPLEQHEQRLEILKCQLSARCGQLAAAMEQQCESDVLAGLQKYQGANERYDYGSINDAVAHGRLIFD